MCIRDRVQHEAAFDALALMRGNQTCAVVDAAEVCHQNVDHVVGWTVSYTHLDVYKRQR